MIYALDPTEIFAANLVGYYKPESYDGSGGNFADASLAEVALAAVGTPTKSSDSDGGYVLYDGDASALCHEVDGTYGEVEDGDQPWLLFVVKQDSAGRMTLGCLSDDGSEAGGLDVWCPDSTDLRAGAQVDAAAGEESDSWQYAHEIDPTEINFIAVGFQSCDPVLVLNGDMYRCYDDTYKGCRLTTAMTIRGAQTYYRLCGHFGASTSNYCQMYESLVLKAPPEPGNLYAYMKWAAARFPALNSRFGFTQSNQGLLCFAGQSNAAYFCGSQDSGSENGNISVYDRLVGQPRPAGIRLAWCATGGEGLDQGWKPSRGEQLRERLINDLQVSADTDTLTVLWMVGESDCSPELHAQRVSENFLAVIDDIATETGRDDILHLWVKMHPDLDESLAPFLSTVRTQQETAAAARANVVLIDVDDIEDPFVADDVHYTLATSQEIWSRALAAAFAYYGTDNWNVS